MILEESIMETRKLLRPELKLQFSEDASRGRCCTRGKSSQEASPAGR